MNSIFSDQGDDGNKAGFKLHSCSLKKKIHIFGDKEYPSQPYLSAWFWHFAKTNNVSFVEALIKIPPTASSFKPVGMCDSHRKGNLNGGGTSESLCSYCLDSAEHMPPEHEALPGLCSLCPAHNCNRRKNCWLCEIYMIIVIFCLLVCLLLQIIALW